MQKPQSHWAVRTALGLSTLAIATAVWTATRSPEPSVGPEQAGTAAPRIESRSASNAVPDPLAAAPKPEKKPARTVIEQAETPQRSPAPGKPAAEDEGEANVPLEVKRLVVTDGISGREPNADPKLQAGSDPIYAFVELRNPTDDAKEIVVTFEHSTGAKVGHVSLEVPAKKPRWRTWARSAHVSKPGDWTAVVTASDGTELARQDFVLTG